MNNLHGEDGSFIWCVLCECWVERADMKRWSPDGSWTHFLCDGCDAELREEVCCDEG